MKDILIDLKNAKNLPGQVEGIVNKDVQLSDHWHGKWWIGQPFDHKAHNDENYRDGITIFFSGNPGLGHRSGQNRII